MPMLLVGQQVSVHDDGTGDWAYCDGWRGVVQGVNNGLYQVVCDRGGDFPLTLFVPPGLLSPVERPKMMAEA